jgi:hypothetical protein
MSAVLRQKGKCVIAAQPGGIAQARVRAMEQVCDHFDSGAVQPGRGQHQRQSWSLAFDQRKHHATPCHASVGRVQSRCHSAARCQQRAGKQGLATPRFVETIAQRGSDPAGFGAACIGIGQKYIVHEVSRKVFERSFDPALALDEPALRGEAIHRQRSDFGIVRADQSLQDGRQDGIDCRLGGKVFRQSRFDRKGVTMSEQAILPGEPRDQRANRSGAASAIGPEQGGRQRIDHTPGRRHHRFGKQAWFPLPDKMAQDWRNGCQRAIRPRQTRTERVLCR